MYCYVNTNSLDIIACDEWKFLSLFVIYRRLSHGKFFTRHLTFLRHQVFDFIGGGELFSYLRKVKYFPSETGELRKKWQHVHSFTSLNIVFFFQQIFTPERFCWLWTISIR
jgi:hypothetical protein